MQYTSTPAGVNQSMKSIIQSMEKKRGKVGGGIKCRSREKLKSRHLSRFSKPVHVESKCEINESMKPLVPLSNNQDDTKDQKLVRVS